MKLVNLPIIEFDKYAKSHPLGSFHQSSNYALFMSEQGYDYDLLGLVDENNNIQAASLILIKKIGLFYRYGYAPKGFLLNYHDSKIIKEFTKKLKDYYYKKNIAFIKINPEISIGEYDITRKKLNYNKNQFLKPTLINLGFKELKQTQPFQALIPISNAVILLKNTNLKTISKQTRNKINKSLKMGLSIETGNREAIDILYNFIKGKKNSSISHYYNYYNAFSRNNSIDVILVKIDFEKCLINLRDKYEKENTKNINLTEKMLSNNNKTNLKRKLASDQALNTYKDNIAEITRLLAKQKETYIAGAITIKYKNRVNIIISGFDQKYKAFSPNHYLHYKLIEYYKKDYDFLELNGITGDFKEDNPYKGLDEFKLGFNPVAFSYIGEFDFIINEGLYTSLDNNGLLAKEFKKK